MEAIIKTLLLEGIDEATIHRVLDVIEEEYEVVENRNLENTVTRHFERSPQEREKMYVKHGVMDKAANVLNMSAFSDENKRKAVKELKKRAEKVRTSSYIDDRNKHDRNNSAHLNSLINGDPDELSYSGKAEADAVRANRHRNKVLGGVISNQKALNRHYKKIAKKNK